MNDLDLAEGRRLPPARVAERGDRRWSELVQEVRAAGLFERRPLYHLCQATLLALSLTAGVAAFVLLGDSWWQLATAVYLGACWTHVAFFGHDVSHRQVVGDRRACRLLGLLVGNVMLGFSYGGFSRHHSTHHAYPNDAERDPDIARRRILLKPDRGQTTPGRARQFVVRHRRVFFFPLLIAESLALRVATLKAMPNRSLRTTVVEYALVAIHLGAYVAALLLVLPPAKAAAFALVQQVLFGLYTESVVAPNHKAMPVQTSSDDRDWLERQLVTSRNLGTSRLTGFVYGGQNFHIEHHLFPSMPRNNARRARPIVIAFCRRHGLPYHEVSVRRAFAELLGA